MTLFATKQPEFMVRSAAQRAHNWVQKWAAHAKRRRALEATPKSCPVAYSEWPPCASMQHDWHNAQSSLAASSRCHRTCSTTATSLVGRAPPCTFKQGLCTQWHTSCTQRPHKRPPKSTNHPSHVHGVKGRSRREVQGKHSDSWSPGVDGGS
jgi:hypothetical protein